MNFYLLGIIFFSIIVIVCIFLLIYFTNDEKRLKEVSDNDLMRLGKVYTKKEFETRMFQQYINILESINNNNYNLLKDIVSDEIYNQILLFIKNDQDNKEKSITTSIKKDFSKLISFEVINDLEIAKLWVKYSSIEYTKGIRKVVIDDQEVDSEVVVKGSNDRQINHEYILTFVKNRTKTENIICPSCGYQTHMLTTSKCIRCDSEIVSKKEHWVYVDKVTTHIKK